MDAVKKENHWSRKVQVGDCVSAPDDYFGKSFRKSILVAGMDITRIYGRVVEVLLLLSNGTDLDQNITFDHKLGNVVQLERKGTELQTFKQFSIEPSVTDTCYAGGRIHVAQQCTALSKYYRRGWRVYKDSEWHHVLDQTRCPGSQCTPSTDRFTKSSEWWTATHRVLG